MSKYNIMGEWSEDITQSQEFGVLRHDGCPEPLGYEEGGLLLGVSLDLRMVLYLARNWLPKVLSSC